MTGRISSITAAPGNENDPTRGSGLGRHWDSRFVRLRPLDPFVRFCSGHLDKKPIGLFQERLHILSERGADVTVDDAVVE